MFVALYHHRTVPWRLDLVTISFPVTVMIIFTILVLWLYQQDLLQGVQVTGSLAPNCSRRTARCRRQLEFRVADASNVRWTHRRRPDQVLWT